jgi:hypothetical protein
VSTISEIKEAIEKLSADERAELEALIWPDWDRSEADTPPGVRERLAQAAKGHFQPGDPKNIQRILSTLE